MPLSVPIQILFLIMGELVTVLPSKKLLSSLRRYIRLSLQLYCMISLSKEESQRLFSSSLSSMNMKLRNDEDTLGYCINVSTTCLVTFHRHMPSPASQILPCLSSAMLQQYVVFSKGFFSSTICEKARVDLLKLTTLFNRPNDIQILFFESSIKQ